MDKPEADEPEATRESVDQAAEAETEVPDGGSRAWLSVFGG